MKIEDVTSYDFFWRENKKGVLYLIIIYGRVEGLELRGALYVVAPQDWIYLDVADHWASVIVEMRGRRSASESIAAISRVVSLPLGGGREVVIRFFQSARFDSK